MDSEVGCRRATAMCGLKTGRLQCSCKLVIANARGSNWRKGAEIDKFVARLLNEPDRATFTEEVM